MEQLKKYVDSAISRMSKPKDMIPFLKQRIFQNFDAITANKIVDHCEFIVINSAKIGVRVNSISLSQQEKATIRSCIYSIYGKNINIIAVQLPKRVKTETPPLPDETSMNTNATWLKVREKLVSRHGEDLIKSWFEGEGIEISCKSNKLLITGRGLWIDQIKNQFELTLESIAKKEHLIIELRYDNSVCLMKGESRTVVILPFQRMSPEKLAILHSKKTYE